MNLIALLDPNHRIMYEPKLSDSKFVLFTSCR